MKNAQIEISNWLNSDRNYEDGVYLYNKYGNNLQLKRLFPGRPQRYGQKLAYELGKLIGLKFDEKPERGIPEIHVALQEKPMPEENPANDRDNGEENAVRAELAAENSEDSANRAEEQANRAEEQAERAEDFAGKFETAAETIGAIAKGETVDNPAYPPVINRIIAESSRLYNERAALKKQQNAVSDENTAENVAKRKALIGQIEAISERLEVLYRTKSAYLESGKMPDEGKLFPSAEAAEPERDVLLQKRNNLRSQITRAKNMLDYQSQKKGDVRNPMPECPKRTALEKRIKEKEKEMAELEKKLGNAD